MLVEVVELARDSGDAWRPWGSRWLSAPEGGAAVLKVVELQRGAWSGGVIHA